MTTFKEVGPALYKQGYEILPIKLGEKRPAVDDWADVVLTKDVLKAWHSNGVALGGAGIRLGNGVMALDVDIDDAEVSRIVQDCAELILGPGPVRIGRAPRCAVLYKGTDLRKQVLKLIDPAGSLHKVELLGKGQQVVAYGIHPDTGSAYEWVDESPLNVAALDLEEIDADAVADLFTAIGGALPEGWRTEQVGGGVVAVGDEDDLMSFIAHNPDRLDLTDSEVEEAVSLYDVPQSYDGWLRFLLACYHQSGGSDVGLEWAHLGCSELPNYDGGEIDRKWRSGTLKAKGDRKPVTFASVLAEVGERRKALATTESIELVDKIKAKVLGADEKFLRTELVSRIAKAALDDFDREQIAKIVQGRLKELTGTSVSIATVRKMLKPKGCAERVASPEWCDDWVYVNSHDAMFSLGDHQVYKFSGFNLKCGRHVPMSENGAKPSAVKFVSDGGYVETVDAMAYLPGVSDQVCTLGNGSRVVNSFNPSSVPVAAAVVSEAGMTAVDVIRRHIRLICGSDENALIIEQWLAHQVQHPGKKILFAPLIQSIQGVGKSFISQLLCEVLGAENVGVVNPSQVISDNNGWSTGVVVNVLEELKISGHNRYEAANALKPLITDPYIQVVDKWVKAHKTYNTTNYICFTNHKDSVPLEDEDRRWWIIFCEIESLDDIGKDFGLTRGEYFEELWTSLRGHPGCLRRWLLSYDITQEFMTLKKAPDTIYKQAMIATERAGVAHLDELAELIREGGKNFNRDVICSADLFTVAEFEIDGFEANTSRRGVLLKKLGYSQMPYQMKVEGKMKRVWTRKVLAPDAARDLLHPVPF